MELKNLIAPSIIKEAIEISIGMKAISDNNSVGGAMFEAYTVNSVNKKLKRGNSSLCTYTKKGIVSKAGESSMVFPDGLSSKEYFNKVDSDSFYKHSAADLFLVENKLGVLHLIDALSFKTSISDNPGPYIHNDASGQIHESITRGSTPSIGKAIIVTYNTKTGEGMAFYYDKPFSSITNLLGSRRENQYGDLEFMATNNKGRYVNSLKVFTRNPQASRKETSFNRGVVIKNMHFVKNVLAKEGVFELLCDFQLEADKIKEKTLSKLANGTFF